MPSARPSEAWFVTTHWTVVLSAQHAGTARSAEALYAYVRRQGHAPHDAQDLTQEFFARLLRRGWLDPVALGKGKFRTFLLVVLKRFLADEWDRARAAKRGGGHTLFSLDAATAEERYRLEPVSALSAERIYERRWALTLLDHTMARLEGILVTAPFFRRRVGC